MSEPLEQPVPASFDPTKPAHVRAVAKKVAETNGEGWEPRTFDAERRKLIFVRANAVDTIGQETRSATRSGVKVHLAPGTTIAHGQRKSDEFEEAHKSKGFVMTKFEPYRGYALLEKLTPEEIHARAAVAGALRVKPWEVYVRTSNDDGGYTMILPSSYSPAKHEKALVEAVEVKIGAEGWFYVVKPLPQKGPDGKDAIVYEARIIPSSPPTFPHAFPYPTHNLATVDPHIIPIGKALADPGQDPMDAAEVKIDFRAGSSMLVSGLPRSGKAEALDNRIPVPVSERFPSGWAQVKELRAGDLVYTPSGATAALLGMSDTVVRDLYDVHFSDGQVRRVTGDHEWRVSSYAQRVNACTRGDDATRESYWNERVSSLRQAAADIGAGVFATVTQIAELGCVPLGQVYDAVKRNDVYFEWASRHEPGSTHQMTTRRKIYEVAGARRALVAAGLGNDLDRAGLGEVASTRQISIAAGLGDSRMVQQKVRVALDRAGVRATKAVTTEVIPAPEARRDKVYPVGEVLCLLADAYAAMAPQVTPTHQTATTAQIAATLRRQDAGGRANWSVDLPAPIQGKNASLPVDPYVLGAWLGDGTSRRGEITVGHRDSDFMTEQITGAWDGTVEAVFAQGTNGTTLLRVGRKDRSLCLRGHEKGGRASCRACVRGVPPTFDNTSLGERLSRLGILGQGKKRIPATYLRASFDQRLALLQGLMDTDGSASKKGALELCFAFKPLALGALELIRSLGIRANMTEGASSITSTLADGTRVRRQVGTRYRIKFATDLPVFRMPRKAERHARAATFRNTHSRLYITDVVPAGRGKAKCLRVDTPDGLYLTGGFIPTHNTVTLTSLVAGSLAGGAELAVITTKAKSVDFTWCQDMVRPGGWGCESIREACAVLGLVYEEGQRRADILAQYGAQNWFGLPPGLMRPLLVIVDEYAVISAKEKIPSGVPKDDPDKIAAVETQRLKNRLEKYVKETIAEMGFVGIRVVLSSQVADATTGLPPALKALLGHSALIGANPSKQQRVKAFKDESSVPVVPDSIRGNDDPMIPKGSGVLESEGCDSVVFKSYFDKPEHFRAALERLCIPKTDRPRPTASEIHRLTPAPLDDAPDERPASALDAGGFGGPDGRDVAAADRLTGAARAAHDHALQMAQARRAG